jgi:hypothetical protein
VERGFWEGRVQSPGRGAADEIIEKCMHASFLKERARRD